MKRGRELSAMESIFQDIEPLEVGMNRGGSVGGGSEVGVRGYPHQNPACAEFFGEEVIFMGFKLHAILESSSQHIKELFLRVLAANESQKPECASFWGR